MRDQSNHSCGGNPESSIPAATPPKAADHSRPAAPASGRPIRLLLADDHPVVLMGLGCSLAERPHLDVVGYAMDGDEAVRKTQELSPDIVLMDIHMSPMDGLTAAATLQRESPQVKILFLTQYNHPERFVRALRAGCRGYVLKSAPAEELVQAIEKIHRGGTFFSSEVSQHALNQAVRGTGAGPQLADLSNRECQVLIGIAEGLTTREIAARLEIEPVTVDTHRVNMARKLNIHDTATFTRFAVRSGLVSVAMEGEPVN